jgi:hypothetical protein
MYVARPPGCILYVSILLLRIRLVLGLVLPLLTMFLVYIICLYFPILILVVVLDS